ncbi:unnamed protein product [Adineta steineri]|uniref:Uncharacterized protein n=1 Tax=Adineta steineri TaxID=433720 RepID=A0A814RKV3_9BILA|nr:unnamed protein product [Adineta steineri]CAF3837103.1 unnamed protein product [Adineta steineri]
MKSIDADPFLVNSINKQSSNGNRNHPWTGRIVAGASILSIVGVIILILLLGIPISALVIGVRYRDPRYCPIEPRISLFLIVSGSISIGSIIFAILISLMTIFSIYQRSSVSIILAIILWIILILSSIFLIVWLIIGSVWTFSVHNRVIHDYDRINHFYLYTYCHPVLYKFTFVYLIVTYILIAISCCSRCFNCKSHSEEEN